MLLNQIFETKIVEGLNRTGRNSTAVIGWGRGMGHIGHMYLASSVITQANESKADPYFVVSRTVGKDDPLTPAEKLSIYKRVFAEHKHIFQSTSDAAPDLNRILGKLQEHGYKKVIVVLGEAEVNAFQYLKSYNGKSTKKGEVLYTFESIDVISRQQTNDPSRTLAGPRATDMRAVLLDPTKLDEDKFAIWRDSMSPKLDDNEVHMIMKLAEHRLKNINEGKVEYNKKTGQMSHNTKDSDQRHGLYLNGKLVKTVNDADAANNLKARNPKFKNATIKKIAEAKLDPKNIAALSQLKQQFQKPAAPLRAPELDASGQADVDDWKKDFSAAFANRTTDPKSKSIPRTRTMPKKQTDPAPNLPAGPSVEFPKDYKTLSRYGNTLTQVIATKDIVEKLKDRAKSFGPLPFTLQSDIDDSLYLDDASPDGIQFILAKNQESVEKLKDYIKMKKSLYKESANDVENGPYEYVVHYNDPKTKTSGTRTVKTTQPAPKSDSPDAKKFFGKWTGHYSAHEKRSDTANRAHDVVSQGEKKTEAMLPASDFAGTEKGYKLGSKGQLKGKTKRPAKAGDLVGETKVVPVEESIELQMASLINLLEGKR
jgi:hypothetical protein